jgi:hypothetical protein
MIDGHIVAVEAGRVLQGAILGERCQAGIGAFVVDQRDQLLLESVIMGQDTA